MQLVCRTSSVSPYFTTVDALGKKCAEEELNALSLLAGSGKLFPCRFSFLGRPIRTLSRVLLVHGSHGNTPTVFSLPFTASDLLLETGT